MVASLISSISRAGLNVVDRQQFINTSICPINISYWNNFLPVVLMAPLILFSPAAEFLSADLISFYVVLLALLTQLVAYSFGYAFRALRVTDIAILSKSADITVPAFLSLVGVYSIHSGVIWILPAILCMFVLAAGIQAAKRSIWASIALVTILSSQGIYSYFVGFNSSLDSGHWGLLSFTFAVLIWRFIFSFLILIQKEEFARAFKFPGEILTLGRFYTRGFLTAITQITFLLAISANQLMLVWPILNTTGFMGAIFAYLFLGERLHVRDLLFILLTFLLTVLAMYLLNYEKFHTFF
ncbi:hypothetical protein [Polynucleobacter sp. AP-Sving-400A-A2]|uniref:hypothetical protein n=1 Tax=Polynucleobacter sp. AP-Sving-400A-A2 TaxID=2081049 RepID=UPI001BFE78B6|nr:hypothetical protein [Polynucleobacter sp. AP-Sving-400A-A2]